MRPSRMEPMYAILPKKKIGRALHGLYLAYFPRGFAQTTIMTAVKKLRALSPQLIFGRALSDRLVFRSVPASFKGYALHSRVSLLILLVNLLFFFVSVDKHNDHIRPWMQTRYGFSFEKLVASGEFFEYFKMLIYSSLLHNNVLHLIFNMAFLLMFVSYLEAVVGPGIVVISYLAGIIFVNPLTSALIYEILKLFEPNLVNTFIHRIDIGCSLGVFTCLGALFYFLRGTLIITTMACLLVAVSACISGNSQDLNHIIAVLIGVFIASRYLPKSGQPGPIKGTSHGSEMKAA